MARILIVFLILLSGSVFSGCAVPELHRDHDLIRSTLLQLNTDQVMDNLVRTYNRMPIVQISYTTAQATVVNTTNIGGSDSQATTASNVLALPAASLAATRSIVTTLLGNATNQNSNQVSIRAEAVTDINSIRTYYDRYLQDNPDALMTSDTRPSPKIAHIWEKHDNKYFYVPIKNKDAFFRLALDTMTQQHNISMQSRQNDPVSRANDLQNQIQNNLLLQLSQ